MIRNTLLILLVILGCSRLQENSIFIETVYPENLATVELHDTITASISYEFQQKFAGAGVILALELLCSEESVDTSISLDTLYAASGYIDVPFRLEQLGNPLCEYNHHMRLHTVRFKLILDRSGEYARVVHSAPLQFYSTNVP